MERDNVADGVLKGRKVMEDEEVTSLLKATGTFSAPGEFPDKLTKKVLTFGSDPAAKVIYELDSKLLDAEKTREVDGLAPTSKGKDIGEEHVNSGMQCMHVSGTRSKGDGDSNREGG